MRLEPNLVTCQVVLLICPVCCVQKLALTGSDAVNSVDQDEAKQLVDKLMTRDTDIVTQSCRHVGSLRDDEFEVRFNTDVFQPHVRHHEPEVRQRVRHHEPSSTCDAQSDGYQLEQTLTLFWM